jgi:hypothetical protein
VEVTLSKKYSSKERLNFKEPIMSDSSPELLKKKHYQSLALSLENTLPSIQQSFMPQVDTDSVKFG